MEQRTAEPTLNNFASHHDAGNSVRYAHLCVNFIKAHYAKLFVWCLVLAVIPVYLVYVHKKLGKLNDVHIRESSKAPTQWKTTDPNLQDTMDQHVPHHRSKEPSIEEFKLRYKKLYVFGRLRHTSDTKQQEPSNIEPLNASSEYISTLNSSYKEDPCASERSGIPNNQMFSCSELLPSVLNIFFLETSCASNQLPKKAGDPTLSEKTACSIYSAAHYNPRRKVILLFTCPFPRNYKWTKDWTILFNLQNFFFGRVDLTEFYANTPLLEFYRGPLAHSSYFVEHQADVFRLVVLYSYGGTYLDIDHITLRPLDDLGINFISHQGHKMGGHQKGYRIEFLSNAGMNFEPNHPFLRACLFNAVLTYLPQVWKTIGPAVVTNTVKSYCKISGTLPHLTFSNLTSCNITILPVYIFYAIDCHDWLEFYRPSSWPYVKKSLDKSYGTHYWNHMGKPPPLFVGSNQPIVMLAKRHCPPIYINAGAILS